MKVFVVLGSVMPNLVGHPYIQLRFSGFIAPFLSVGYLDLR